MNRVLLFSGVAAAIFIVLGVLDVWQEDDPFSIGALALDLVEKALLAAAIVATAYVSLESRDMRRDRARLLNDLTRARAEGDRWRATAKVHLDGLSRAIRDQFDAWQLTEGEADIATLMLKGLSHKEIARLRTTTEATVRQQAGSIYRKSDLSSRAELSAFFLEDLLAPGDERSLDSVRKITLVERRN